MSDYASNLDYVAANAILQSTVDIVCTYCGVDLLEINSPQLPLPDRAVTRDHVWPRRLRSTEGGRVGVVPCCHACNQRKGEMSPGDWIMHMAKHGYAGANIKKEASDG